MNYLLLSKLSCHPFRQFFFLGFIHDLINDLGFYSLSDGCSQEWRIVITIVVIESMELSLFLLLAQGALAEVVIGILWVCISEFLLFHLAKLSN